MVNAISNFTLPSDGLYAAPTSNFPAPSGPWGSFWNAASSVLMTATGAIVSLVAVVWNAAVAAFTYLNRLFV